MYDVCLSLSNDDQNQLKHVLIVLKKIIDMSLYSARFQYRRLSFKNIVLSSLMKRSKLARMTPLPTFRAVTPYMIEDVSTIFWKDIYLKNNIRKGLSSSLKGLFFYPIFNGFRGIKSLSIELYFERVRESSELIGLRYNFITNDKIEFFTSISNLEAAYSQDNLIYVFKKLLPRIIHHLFWR